MRILISAEESAGIQAMRVACNSPHEIVAVLTGDESANNRPGATVGSVAKHFKIPVWPARLVKHPEFAETIRRESIDLLLNVHSLHLVNEEVLHALPLGALNLHPGPLPRYAGMNAPGWAIINGESNHGVTLHWMEAGIDTGPIAWQSMFDLSTGATALEVSRSCSRLGVDLIRKLLSTDPDEIPRIKQDLSMRSYHGFEIPFGGEIPWHEANLVERYVRACNYCPLAAPWGTPAIRFRGASVGLLEVRLTDRPCTSPPGSIEFRDGTCLLATSDRWLELKRGLIESTVIGGEDLQDFTQDSN